jgi:diguanylate cyclase (GGDEF)-like protein
MSTEKKRSTAGRRQAGSGPPQTQALTISPSELVEANERLVLAALRAFAEAEAAAGALKEMARIAALDELTQLPNRNLFLDRFVHAIAIAKRRKERLALLFLDLDNFKQINDTLGHAVGDLVLQRVAHCLSTVVRKSDTVSRHGGDEFLILLEIPDASRAALLAEKVRGALAIPTKIGKHMFSLSTSIGISIYPDDHEDASALIGLADSAMYRAKKQGCGGPVFHGAAPQKRE